MAYIGSQPTKVVSRQSSRVYRYTATAGQTAFSGADVDNQVLNVTPSDVEVHMNGLLLDPTDYTVTSSSVTLGTAASAGDELTVTGMVSFEVADTYNKATADARYVDVAGDTMTGALALPSGGLTVGTDQLTVDSSGQVTMPYQPAFDAVYSTGPVSGPAYVIQDTVYMNRGGHFNSSNGRFTVPVSGVYKFMTSHLKNNTTVVTRRVFHKNGSVVLGGRQQRLNESTSSTYGDNGTFSIILQCSAGDYIQVYQSAGSAYGRPDYDYFSGYLIG